MNSQRMQSDVLARPVRNRQRPLAVACATALLGLALAGAASAQQAQVQEQASTPTDARTAPVAKQAKAAEKKNKKSENTVSNLDAVVVTGIRGSIENSLRAKQNSNDIIEAISAEDIGKLPDASIAESLSRVPGLATQRMNGRASTISIRGLSPDFAGTTLNGREQATTGENRGVEYDQYPSELISGAAIYKTPDASLIGQGLSGTVDLHTIKPLDLSKRTFVANLRGEHTSNGKLNPGSGVGTLGHRASFSYIDQFFDHTLGLAVGFAQLDSPIQEKQYQAWWWSVDNGSAGAEQNWGAPHTPGLPDNVISQEGMQLRAQSQSQLRNGLMTVLEWAPGDHYHSTLDLYYSTFNEKKYTNGAQWSSSPWDNIAYSNVGITPAQPYPVVTSGTISGIAPILQNQYTKEHDKLFSAGWNNQYDFGNGWAASADLSYSSAKKRLHDAYLFTGLAGGAFTNVAFNTPLGNGYPYFSPAVNLADPSAVVFTDPDGYGYNGRQEFDHQKDTIKAMRLEVSHPLGWIFSDFTLGADYSERTKTKTADVDFAWLNGNGSTSGTYDNHFSTPVNGAYLRQPTSLGYGGIPGILYYNVLGALYNQFYLTQRNGQGDWSRNYTVKEKVPVAYLKLNIDTALGDVPLRGNVGVQFVRTDQSSQALQTNGDTLVGRIADGAKYNNVLPSLNLAAQLTDRQYLRFGFAKTMSRGRIDDEKVATSAGVGKVQNGPAAGQVLWSGSGGNPKLKPYVAVGTDLSYEFYFGKSSYFAAAVFNKNLLNYIYNQTTLNYDFSHYTNDNPTLTPTSNIGSFTRPANGTGGKMQGLELSGALEGGLLAQALDGFGVQANFSLTNSNIPTSSISSIPGGPTTLPGLSRKVANLALYYEKYGWSVRVAERYRSSFTGEAVALFDQLGYTKVLANKQTDLQIGYAFTGGSWNGLSLLLQVSNLTNTPDKTVQVSGLPNNVQVARPLEYDTWGRTVMLGVNYKL
ncbi:TonB-dependent receptor [Rhodanobacter sp. FW510-R12]|uniref:TonB-dependent receptor n=1 Tax=unclassified Rhodanobacter TaxID=2621553 RepID=UPI0007A9A142|nr:MULTISPECIES: TonB-dependent receptor [unclassified Rhodanobacter]KZC17546.1 TonB-dependent receptor [Rhodanobacter sp. FW104-R8]KZC28761.1 TonB-dependent receptor [Rhodanobacter sp. FW510-T8]KZC33116.1 TonB-dependent receptor [Rhodanobacter sp. FW510-R10]